MTTARLLRQLLDALDAGEPCATATIAATLGARSMATLATSSTNRSRSVNETREQSRGEKSEQRRLWPYWTSALSMTQYGPSTTSWAPPSASVAMKTPWRNESGCGAVGSKSHSVQASSR